MRMPKYADDRVHQAVEMIRSVHWQHEEGDHLADLSLDLAALLLHNCGLLDLLITRASKLRMTP
jgi:hypothetical protein